MVHELHFLTCTDPICVDFLCYDDALLIEYYDYTTDAIDALI